MYSNVADEHPSQSDFKFSQNIPSDAHGEGWWPCTCTARASEDDDDEDEDGEGEEEDEDHKDEEEEEWYS